MRTRPGALSTSITPCLLAALLTASTGCYYTSRGALSPETVVIGAEPTERYTVTVVGTPNVEAPRYRVRVDNYVRDRVQTTRREQTVRKPIRLGSAIVIGALVGAAGYGMGYALGDDPGDTPSSDVNSDGVFNEDDLIYREESAILWSVIGAAVGGLIGWAQDASGSPVVRSLGSTTKLRESPRSAPAEKVDVIVSVGGKRVTRKTDSRGIATFDLVGELGVSTAGAEEKVQLAIDVPTAGHHEADSLDPSTFLHPYYVFGRAEVRARESAGRSMGNTRLDRAYRVLSRGNSDSYRIKAPGSPDTEGFVTSPSARLVRYGSQDTPDELPITLRPPRLVIARMSLNDPNDNDFLDAEESAVVEVLVRNQGDGTAFDVTIVPEADSMPGVTFRPVKVGDVGAGEEVTARIHLQADPTVATAERRLTVHAREFNGFDALQPRELVFSTREFQRPAPRLLDHGIADANGNGKAELGEQIDVTVRIVNTGSGLSEHTNVTIGNRQANLILLAEPTQLGDIAPGESRDVVFTAIPNTRFADDQIEFSVAIAERRGKYGTTDAFAVPIDRQTRTLSPIVIHGDDSSSGAGRNDGGLDSLTIDVEQNIPQGRSTNPNAVAVVLGIRDYSNAQVPAVEYARRDARFVREYVVKTLGYAPSNILPRNPNQTLTLAAIRTLVRSTLRQYIKPDGSSDVFFYFAGHGAPNLQSGEMFFVPQDCDPNAISSDNAYRAEDLYHDLNALKARSLTIVVEACFSGLVGDGSVLTRGVSPVGVSIESPLPAAGMRPGDAAFLAASGNQYANWYPAKRHGLFTYFFLKGLQGAADRNGDRKLTVGELRRYLEDDNDGVPYWSGREFQRRQTPQVRVVDDESRVMVEYAR